MEVKVMRKRIMKKLKTHYECYYNWNGDVITGITPLRSQRKNKFKYPETSLDWSKFIRRHYIKLRDFFAEYMLCEEIRYYSAEELRPTHRFFVRRQDGSSIDYEKYCKFMGKLGCMNPPYELGKLLISLGIIVAGPKWIGDDEDYDDIDGMYIAISQIKFP